MRSVFALVILFGVSLSWCAYGEGPSCTYTTYKWNTHLRRAIDYRTVRHPYSDLQPAEIHEATGCTVCEEDQVEIGLPGIDAFRVCRILKAEIRMALVAAMEEGQEIFSVTGYRVGMTKGGIDADGNRTQFSNHSFGVAIDINDRQNGLYDHCATFGPGCRLLKGGTWSPSREGSLTFDSPVVKALKGVGLRWGGEIEGNQKDFMHFSPSGY